MFLSHLTINKKAPLYISIILFLFNACVTPKTHNSLIQENAVLKKTLSQEEIADMQRDIQEKSKDLEFIMGKIQAEQNETAEKVFRDLNPSLQKILSELIAAKEIKLLLGRENVLFADTSLDLTDDVTSMLDELHRKTAHNRSSVKRQKLFISFHS